MLSHSRHAARAQEWPELPAGRAPLSSGLAPAAERHAVRRPRDTATRDSSSIRGFIQESLDVSDKLFRSAP